MAKKIFSAFLTVVLMVTLLFGGVPMVSATSKSNKTIKITKQPVSVTVSNGTTAKVTLKADGYKLSYKWYVKDKSKSKYTVAKSFKKNSYSVKMSKSVKGRKVYCVVTNKYGKKVKSNTVTLNMGKTLKIKKQPVSVKMGVGGTATVKLTASGEKLTYKWYYKDKNKSKFSVAKSFKKNSYSVKMSNSSAGRQVYCVVKDKYGSTITSKTVTLSLGKSITISTQPQSVKVKKGTVAKVSVNATGDKLKYQWYFKDAGKTNYTLATAFKSNYYSVNMGDNVNGRMVYCLITDTYGLTKKTNVVTLSMGKTLKITKQPTSVVAVKNTKATVNVLADGDGVKYAWYYKDTKASSWTKDKSTNNYYSATMTSSVNGRKVYCVVTDAYGSSVVSNTVTLTMATELVINTQPKSQIVYYGSQADISVVASGDGLTYTWYCKKENENFQVDTDNTTNCYIKTVDYSLNNAQVYCEITDKYGVVVKTNTVTITGAQNLGITAHLEDATAHCNEKLNLVAEVSGDELKFEWYCKKADEENFSVVDGFGGCTFDPNATEELNGAKVYCKVTDILNNSVTTNTVTLTVQHNFDDGVVSESPTCQEEGVMLFSCSDCTHSYTEAIEKSGHDWTEEWTISKEPTPYEIGEKYRSCQTFGCDKIDTVVVDKISEEDAVYSIFVFETVEDYNQNNKKATVLVGENGAYKLSAIEKEGYIFKGWKGANTEDFAASGKITGNVSVYAVWEVDGTDTAEKLIARVNAGVKDIKIAGDITVNQPIYVSYKTNIYSDGEYCITRAADYDGDIFVVGQDEDGNTSILMQRSAVLSLGGGEGTLTIDGNRDNVTVDVVGSALFVADSSTLNIYDGVQIINNKKVGNERTFQYAEMGFGTYATERAGGAAIVIFGATINMYGGLIDNNIVATEYTVLDDGEGGTKSVENNGCGGAIFSYGNINMYGGTISNNEALRGGAMFVGRISYIEAGEISNNYSHVYGGAISTSSSSDADLHIGTEGEGDLMLIKNNHSARAGGAIYSNTCSPILVHGNTEFQGNISDTSGGAIYTAGPLLIENAEFNGNECSGSGGAIYHHYSNLDYQQRFFTAYNTVFNGNKSGLGGAIVLSASADATDLGEGTIANFTDCNFLSNQSESSGGAIYVTRNSDLTVDNCTFKYNTAKANAGAVGVQSAAMLSLTNSMFESNSAKIGGAISSSSNTKINVENTDFTTNTAVGTNAYGGAIYVSDVSNVTFKNMGMYNNTSESNGGAMYIKGYDVAFDSTCEFIGNSSGGHGGAIYAVYENLEEGVKKGTTLTVNGVLFEKNTALAGGAISARTNSVLNLTDVNFIENSTPNAVSGQDQQGGGAIYSNNSEVNMNNVTFDSNTSGYYGGTLKLDVCETTINNSSITKSSGGTGGIMGVSAGTITINGLELTENTSTYYGGIYITRATADLQNITATDNNGNFGSVISVNGEAEVCVKDSTFTANEANHGGVIYTIGNSTTTMQNVAIDNNTANTHGGAIYTENATVKIGDNVSVNNNYAKNNGGAIYLRHSLVEITGSDTEISNNNAGEYGGAFYVNYVIDEEADNAKLGGTLNITNATVSENTALYGGAITARTNSIVNLNDMQLTNNSTPDAEIVEGEVKGSGGAIFINNSNITLSNVEVCGNTSDYYGGAIMADYATVTLENTTLSNNSTPEANSENKTGGGAIYSNHSNITLSNVEATENSSGYYGGVIMGSHSTVTLNQGTEFMNNTGGTGAVLHLSSGMNLNADGVTFTNNISTANGNLYLNGGEFNFTNLTASGNTAKWNGGVFYVNSNSVVNIDSSDINNNSTATGGAFYMLNGALNVTNTTITNNAATSNGGVLYAQNCNATFGEGAVVSKNTATDGGAIYTVGATVNAKDGATFTDNNASSEGGAIYSKNNEPENKDSIPSVVNINNAMFEKNAANAAGAIQTTDDTVVTINGAEFKENAATYNGGAGYFKYTTANITDSIFTGNVAGDNSNGGALYLTASNVTVSENSKFESNIAGNHGGAIYVVYTKNSENQNDGTTLTVNGGLFTKNSALGGGAVSVRTACEAIFNGTEFVENTVTGYSNNADGDGEGGGAIYQGFGIVTLNNATLTSNTAEGFGGAIAAMAGTVNIFDSSFTTNTANKGGAINSLSGTTINIDDSTFEGNESTCPSSTASQAGGDIGGGAISIKNGSLTVKGTTFDGNKTGYYGAAIHTNGTTVTIGENTLVTNAKGATGAALYFKGGSHVTISDSSITNNTANSNGVVYANGGTFTANNITATGNKAYQGGVLYTSGGSTVVTLNNCNWSTNNATNGGVIYMSSAKVEINGGGFNSNNATSGGVVYNKYGKLTVTDATFSENTATNGGVVYTQEASSVVTLGEGTTATDNTTTQYGGVVYALNNAKVVLSGAELDNNAAVRGGATFVGGAKLETSENTIFSNNTTSENGGAVYVTWYEYKANEEDTENTIVYSETKIVDSEFKNNSARLGGAIYNTSADIEIEGGVYSKNSSNLGGAIYSTAGELALNGSTFTENSAVLDSDGKNGNGGAVCVVGSTLTGTGENVFDSNSAAGHGGAMYVSYIKVSDTEKTPGVANFTGGEFKNNSAVSGGAISSRTACIVTLNGTILTGNSASSTDTTNPAGGGAIYSNDNTLTLSGAIFDGNSTGWYGGAITAQNANVTIDGNTQIKNSTGITGVALNFRGNGTYNITNSSLVDNISTASNSNGVIYVNSGAKLNISGLTASGNKSNSGVMYSSGSAIITIEESNFNNNSAISYGGVIDHRSSGKLTISDSTFNGNTAGISGGVIRALGTGVVEVNDCTFDGNEATATKTESTTICRGGGAIFVGSSANVIVNGGTFVNNNAAGTKDDTIAGKEMTDCGGAIAVDGGTLTVNNATFNGNTANNGAAIGTSRATTTTMLVNNCLFNGNISTKNGGGIYIQNGVKNETDSIIITDCEFIDNTAKDASGSSVYIRTNSSATFKNLKSSGGVWGYKGAVYVTTGARVTMEGSVDLGGNDDVFITGAETTGVVNYATEIEKSTWETAITTASGAQVTYQSVTA